MLQNAVNLIVGFHQNRFSNDEARGTAMAPYATICCKVQDASQSPPWLTPQSHPTLDSEETS